MIRKIKLIRYAIHCHDCGRIFCSLDNETLWEERRYPVDYMIEMGWRKKNGKWYCSICLPKEEL